MRIDIWGWNREPSRGDHQDLLRLAQTADELGFGGVWFNEFHFTDPPQAYPSTLLLAAAIFARTERLRVGTAVLVLPMHEPHLLAEEIAQLDWQGDGRIDIGLGRGTLPSSFERVGIDPATTRERFERGYRVLMESWRDLPLVQTPHPPLFIGGASAETLEFAHEHGIPLLLGLEPGEHIQLDLYGPILAERGGPSLIPRSSLARFVTIGATPAKAAEAIDTLVDRIQARRLEMSVALGKPTAPMDRDALLAKQFIAGTPDQCVAQIEALGAKFGMANIRCVFNGSGAIGADVAAQAMMLFGREVLPAFHGGGA